MKDLTCWCKPPYDNICASCRWLEYHCQDCEQHYKDCTCPNTTTDDIEQQN